MTANSTATLAAAPRAPQEAPSWFIVALRGLVEWIYALRRGPQPLTVYTIAGLPDPTKYRNHMVALSNGASSQPFAVSDGTIWRYASGSAV